jgi:hypothetical protein
MSRILCNTCHGTGADQSVNGWDFWEVPACVGCGGQGTVPTAESAKDAYEPKLRILKLGTLNISGVDYFAVLDANPKVSFRYMLDGVEVVEKSAYDRLYSELVQVQFARDVNIANTKQREKRIAALEQENARLKAALEKCKEQRNEAIMGQGDDFYWNFPSYDAELEQILEGNE